MRFRAAVIGCGAAGSRYASDPRVAGVYSHAGAYAACPDTDLVAVCDVDPARLRDSVQQWNVPAQYDDAATLLRNEQPDIVSICTPDATHFALTRLALETTSTRAVLAEKPLSLELTEAETLVHIADQRGVPLAVNYVRRFAASHREVEQRIRAGELGKIQTVSGFYTKGLLHNGTHWFDLARFLVGEVTEVQGFDVLQDGNIDPTLDAFLRFDNGAAGHLHGCDSSAFSLFEMDIVGTRGRVAILDSGYHIVWYDRRDSPHFTGYHALVESSRVNAPLGDVTLDAVQDLVESARDRRAPRCSGVDGVRALAIAVAVRESARACESRSPARSTVNRVAPAL